MVPGAPLLAQPEPEGAVANTWTSEFSSSRTTTGRVWQSATVPYVVLDHDPVAGLKTSSLICGLDFGAPASSSRLVFTAANTRPAWSAWMVFRFRWSSGCFGPRTATPPVQTPSGWLSVRQAQYTVSSRWLLHITPILFCP